MSAIANEYERWFADGHRDLSQFLISRNIDDDAFRECVLTDQYLRHQTNQPVAVSEYAAQFERIAADENLQLELWLEAFGYLEERTNVTDEQRREFLAGVPAQLRAKVEEELGQLSNGKDHADAEPAAGDQVFGDAPPESDRYRIEHEIGRGAFGTVYRAWDTQLQRFVALKVLRAKQSADALFAEARLVAGLDVPGIVSVHDCGVGKNGQPFLVTALVEGPDLSEWVSSSDQSDRSRICRVFIRLCESLQHAHDAGIVHRDIKPSNVIVREGDNPVLLDFGLALGNSRAGREGELVGTPAYMSPEQARGEGHLVDGRSDIFSLGVLLLETLTGQRPWESRSSRELIREIGQGQVRSVRDFDSTVPLQLDRICTKATASAMSERYQSATDFAEDLKWFCDGPDRREGSSSSRLIAPRGLRPYTKEDAEAFWQLLPGQRNGRGVPDCVQWWLDQLTKTDRTYLRSVLVLYGPGGSGKSSLMHAGIVPFLNPAETTCVAVDASEMLPPESLSSNFLKCIPRELEVTAEVHSSSSLPDLIATIRDSSLRRTLVVVDQFEQLLASGDQSRLNEVLLALRQADGERVQFVLIVRDEFWSAISRLMRELDAPLRDGRNAIMLEPFNRRHAGTVLRMWAQALSAVNGEENGGVAKHAPEDFVDRALNLVVDGDHVIPVRLALLATVLGEDGWNEQRLDEIASKHSLSSYYLDSALGSLAPAARRRFAGPAREILRCLTPQVGRIRGPSRSRDELRTACGRAGLALSDSDFGDVIDLLERQLHLVIPVERQSCEDSTADSGSADETQVQLPHDFLVSEIRPWLDDFDRSTFHGRAIVDRRAASERWREDQRTANLAGPIDCIRFGLLTRPRTQEERRFVRTSALRQLVRAAIATGAAAVLVAVFQFALLRSQGQEIVRRLLASNLIELRGIIAETRQHKSWTSNALNSEWQKAGDSAGKQKDRIALALLADDSSYGKLLAERLPHLPPEVTRIYALQMREDLDAADRRGVVNQLAEFASDESALSERRLNAAIAIGILQPDHRFWIDFSQRISELLVDANPTSLGWLSEGLYPVRRHLISSLTDVLTEDDPAKSRTATFLLAEFAADDPQSLVDLIEHAAVNQLGAVFPTVAEANAAVDEMLSSRYKATKDAWKEADAAMAANEERGVGIDRLAAMDSLRVDFARRIGNLGAALILRGKGNLVVNHLKFRDDPTVRGYLIRCYSAGAGSAEPLVDMLVSDGEHDAHSAESIDVEADVAAALLQMLGSLPASSQVPGWIRTLAIDLYQTSQNAELNATAEWYLRKHGYEADLAVKTPNEAVGYRTSEGHTMVRLPGGIKATVGASQFDRSRTANEQRRELHVPEGLYVARDELTAEQFNRFRSDTTPGSRPVPLEDAQRTAMRIGFFSAASYCNWLSEKEGIPEDQWCYLPNEAGVFGPGMQVADDHLQRRGYQIPTPDFWEYACRGGTSTPRVYGHGTELSSHYIRWAGAQSVQRGGLSVRLPNHFGLFDVLGNSAEWTVGLVDRKRNGAAFRNSAQRGPNPPRRFRPGGDPRERSGPFERSSDAGRNGRPGPGFGGGPILVDVAGKTIQGTDQFVVLGGAFDSPAHRIRSSDRSVISPPKTNKPLTLRLMRLIRSE